MNHSDFLLERFVHHILKDDPRDSRAGAGRTIFADALSAGADPRWLLSEILWPAAECTQQLRHDQIITPRVFNHAVRTLANLASQLAPAAASKIPATQRFLFIASAPGEPSDLGAHLLSILAESHGFSVQFAGANLSASDILFALNRLEPHAVILHGSLVDSFLPTQNLLAKLRHAELWPKIQFATAGAMLENHPGTADISAQHPVELLELLALCPDHRAAGDSPLQQEPLHFLTDPTACPHGDAVRDLLFHYFPPRRHAN
ncbi:MAG TPA: hypothetical protein VGN88_02655 [Phycisphaerae bacterium]|jgi:methanogenic corrinoid protein MtbC1